MSSTMTIRLEDAITPEQAIKDPFVLEFLNLKDEYSESDLEDALKVLAAEYQTVLPDEKLLADEIQKTQAALGARGLGLDGE
jgi:hypothetical protein